MTDQDISIIQECAEKLKDVWRRNYTVKVNPSYRDLWIEDLEKSSYHAYQAVYRAKTFDRFPAHIVAQQFIQKCQEMTDVKAINDRAEFELAGANSAFS